MECLQLFTDEHDVSSGLVIHWFDYVEVYFHYICFVKFCFEYVKFKKPIRYPSGNFEWVVSYNSLNRAWKRDLAENVYVLRVKKKYAKIVA